MLSQMNILSRLSYLFKSLPITVPGTVFDEMQGGTNDLICGREILRGKGSRGIRVNWTVFIIKGE